MGSVLLREERSINKDGTTQVQTPVPTLTLLGEKDGLLRISRGAESFWHHTQNIMDEQKGKYPVVAYEGASHSSFMDSTMLPSAVVKQDLKPEIEESVAHEKIGKSMVNFIANVLGNKQSEDLTEESAELLQPLIDAMFMEGSESLKPPCYTSELVSPEDPTCMARSGWVPEAQRIMGGDLSENISVHTTDNFHRVYSVTPVHLPTIKNTCDGTEKCTLDTITVSMNFYNPLDTFDTGLQPIGSVEMKAKLMSRQAMQRAAGNKDADFHETDEVGQRCAEINQKSLEWALAHSSEKAVDRYNRLGKKLVMGDDEGPYNAGPLWIWKYQSYEDNADKTETTVQAPMMRTPVDYAVQAAAGFHYCKLLSPFRAMEWIYVDALYDRDGLSSAEAEMEQFLQI